MKVVIKKKEDGKFYLSYTKNQSHAFLEQEDADDIKSWLLKYHKKHKFKDISKYFSITCIANKHGLYKTLKGRKILDELAAS